MPNIAVVTRVYDIRITVGRVECRYPHGQTRCHPLFHSRPLHEFKKALYNMAPANADTTTIAITPSPVLLKPRGLIAAAAF
jgi:hypothetical protein